MQEIWKEVPGFPKYQVSSLGIVKSFKRNQVRILKQRMSSSGYLNVILCDKGKIKGFTVHSLVAMSFLNHIPCRQKLVIDHINDNKLDNRVENLQIVTTRYNVFKTQGKNTSIFKGVSWSNQYKKWRADIMINKKQKYLGAYEIEYDAHLAYQNELKKIEQN
ncbi:HNH nuclease [uncultured Caudovirales phage]|uniref:HNH nuclease n=1 Tax=uncultured Caudovirales phage TaxID=2100421 RepID=A0A6J7X5Q2_9CAUD|nr:HNH nuclease [uncultured Caudovirales phage]